MRRSAGLLSRRASTPARLSPRSGALAHPPQLHVHAAGTPSTPSTPRHKTAWERGRRQGPRRRLNAEAEPHFERVDQCFRVLLGRIATALVAQLSDELDEVLADYAAFKRAAAVLDFDDLLERARQARARATMPCAARSGERYRHIFVDEFQDTDPIQAEILFRIAADEARRALAGQRACGPASLFMVGDPKQAIYRFRGADVGSYAEARAAIERLWPDNILQVTANFRSRPAILDHINRCFARRSSACRPARLCGARRRRSMRPTTICRASAKIDDGAAAGRARRRTSATPRPRPSRSCATRLIGNLRVRGRRRRPRAADRRAASRSWRRPAAELWRYERALEAARTADRLPGGQGICSGARKCRICWRLRATSADAARHAGVRRPDARSLGRPDRGGAPRHHRSASAGSRIGPTTSRASRMLTDADHVAHPIARRALAILQELRRRARATTPSLLLAEAMRAPHGAARYSRARKATAAPRAAANVEAFLERARPYGVRGLKAFVRDVTRDWREGAPRNEGRVDAEGDAIEIITIHSAKGLEWPVVIPINTGSEFRSSRSIRPSFVR